MGLFLDRKPCLFQKLQQPFCQGCPESVCHPCLGNGVCPCALWQDPSGRLGAPPVLQAAGALLEAFCLLGDLLPSIPGQEGGQFPFHPGALLCKNDVGSLSCLLSRQQTFCSRKDSRILPGCKKGEQFPVHPGSPLYVPLGKHALQGFRDGLEYCVHALCQLVGQVPVGDHLVHCGFVHGNSQFVQVHNVRHLCLRIIHHLPVHLSQDVLIH